MPAYKDIVRQTPKGFAKFLLKDEVCKHCRFWERIEGMSYYGHCLNSSVNNFLTLPALLRVPDYFGCNKWDK